MAEDAGDDGGDGFLDRWSRRKRAARRAAEPEARPAPAAAPDAQGADEPPISPEELAALPPLDQIVPGTDIRPFLRAGVPQALRNAALRRMWMLDPAIRDHADPAVDYAWDWNSPGGVPGSGGRLTQDGVRRMLDALLPEPAAGARTAETAAGEADSEMVADLAEVPDPAPQSAAVGGAAVSGTPPPAPDEPASGSLPSRRHGSARPT
ncbi:MAG: DUF3306 domain-containing protein [Gemmobacter sp.]